MKNNFKIAFRFMKSNKAQTILISLGIALGVTVQLFMGLLINNLNDNMVNKTVGNTSQITISSSKDEKYILNYESIINEIKDKEENKVTNIMGVLDSHVLANDEASNMSILVRGIEYSETNDIYNLNERIISGKFPEKENEVLIGKGISEELGLNINDELTFSILGIGERTVVISGIADFKVKNLNNLWALTRLDYAQDFFGQAEKITSIEMKVDNDYIFDTDIISKEMSNYLGEDFEFSNWKEDNESLLDALSGQQTSSITIQVFIVISVTMSIAGVLAISVLQKSKQIGILKAMGIKDRSAASIFVLEGLLFGVIGAVAGTVIGTSMFKVFSMMVKTSEGTPLVPGNMYYGFIIISVGISIIAAVIASVLAASKSLRLDPMDIIRNN